MSQWMFVVKNCKPILPGSDFHGDKYKEYGSMLGQGQFICFQL